MKSTIQAPTPLRFAEKALASPLDVEQKIDMDHCIEHICSFYALDPSALSERTRVRKHSEARAVVAWLMRRSGSKSLTDVASYFNRDVATMSTAVRKLEGRLREDDEFRARLDAIQRNIKL